MAELFQRIRTQLSELIKNLDKRMRMWLALGGLFVVLLVAIILFLTKPEYVPLVADVDSAEQAAVVARLEEENMTHKAEGNSVLVDIDDLTAAKMAIAVDLNISSDDYSWTDVFAETSFTMTSEVREHQIMQALTTQLSKGMKSIEGVKDAIVTLNVAQDTSFLLDDKNESSVSIILDLESGFQFSQQQVSGLVNLVMNSVKNLPKENITIVDSTGQTLNKFSEDTDAFIASSNFEQTNSVEKRLEDKLTNFLGAIYGRTHVRVMAAVSLNFDDFETQSKVFSPPVDGITDGMIRSMQELTETATSGDTASGVPGTDSNITDYPAGSSGSSNIESASRTVNYEMNELYTVLERAKGGIEDITISILIDTQALADNVLTDEQEQEVKDLVTSAAGLETKTVKVAAQPFVDDELGFTYKSTEADIGPGIPLWLVGAIIGALLVGVVVFFLITRSKASKQKAEEIAEIQAQEEEKRQSELEEIKTDIEDKSSPKYQIEKFIDAKPEAVAALLRSWMAET